MAVGTYKLPICDGCKLPWLPTGWKQNDDPRTTKKKLRCGKCKSSGWDREHKAEMIETAVNPFDPTETIEMPRNMALNAALESVPRETLLEQPSIPAEDISGGARRCRHRMTNCPICHPKEAA